MDFSPTSTESVHASIDQCIRAVRTHLGMDVAFVSEFIGEERVFRNVDSGCNVPLHEGDSLPMSEGYCWRVIKGLIPELIPDTSQVRAAQEIPETTLFPIGAHMSVPILLADGRLYGTFCCFSLAANSSLNERDLQMMRAFADVIGQHIDHDLQIDSEREEKLGRIRLAMEQNQPTMVYQPIYDLEAGAISGLECLARFQTPPNRTPDVWFNEAAEVNLGEELELRAIRTALQELHPLPFSFFVALNCSPQTILSGQIPAALDGLGIPAERILLELTEHAHVTDYQALEQALAPLRERKVRVAIDDAGAGYASMRHILSLQPNFIKLDMSLTRDIDKDRNRRALASALIEFARQTEIEIIAEGVENESELSTLQGLGVRNAQGYYLSRPLSLATLSGLLK